MPRRNRAKERKEREAALRAATMEAEIKLATTRQVTAEAVLGELLRIARVDIGQAFNEDGSLKDIHQIPEDVRRAISGIDVEEVKASGETLARVKKVRFWDKKGALELLGKHLALFIERQKVEGTTEVVVRYAANAPGTLNRGPGEDDEE